MDAVDKERNYICIGDKKVVCKLCNKQFSKVAHWHKHDHNVHIIKRKKKASPKIYQCIVYSKQLPKLSKFFLSFLSKKIQAFRSHDSSSNKCSNEADKQMPENYKNDDNDQIVPSVLCVREETECMQMIINIRHKPLTLNV